MLFFYVLLRMRYCYHSHIIYRNMQLSLLKVNQICDTLDLQNQKRPQHPAMVWEINFFTFIRTPGNTKAPETVAPRLCFPPTALGGHGKVSENSTFPLRTPVSVASSISSLLFFVSCHLIASLTYIPHDRFISTGVLHS